MTKRKPKAKSRFAPTDKEVAERRAAGYALSSTLAADHGVAASTVYNWASRWLREGTKVAGLPAAFKRMGHVWILVAAVESKVSVPTAATS
jgi:hypothetical protein